MQEFYLNKIKHNGFFWILNLVIAACLSISVEWYSGIANFIFSMVFFAQMMRWLCTAYPEDMAELHRLVLLWLQARLLWAQARWMRLVMTPVVAYFIYKFLFVLPKI
jgi:hypothetical protein